MSKFSLLILSAGFGTRMSNLTMNIPKPLLSFHKRTLLSNTINFFKDIGCNEFFINTHYLHNKIESYIYNNYNSYPINLIYEPSILGTGGAIKNIFNYTQNKNICVVNSDIFWQKENKLHILDFLKDFNKISDCKILLSKKNNFLGLKKIVGDFSLTNGYVSSWSKGNELIFYSGLQILSSKIFKKKSHIFSMNEVWNDLIYEKNLKGTLIESNILHVGDKNSFENL
tara:strand:+ start:88 stop:768 length:681 start_codon:yes stop_codon:yes gene_type:complete